MEKYTVKGYFGEVYSSMIRELGNKKSIFKFCKENENAYVKNKMGVTLTEDKYVEMCNNLPNTNLLTNIVSNGPSWVFERTRITGADDYYVKTPSHEDYVNLTKSFLEFTKKNGASTFGE